MIWKWSKILRVMVVDRAWHRSNRLSNWCQRVKKSIKLVSESQIGVKCVLLWLTPKMVEKWIKINLVSECQKRVKRVSNVCHYDWHQKWLKNESRSIWCQRGKKSIKLVSECQTRVKRVSNVCHYDWHQKW